MKKVRTRKDQLFAAYIGDEFVTLGTRQEIINELKISRSKFWRATKELHDDNKRLIIILIEEEDNE